MTRHALVAAGFVASLVVALVLVGSTAGAAYLESSAIAPVFEHADAGQRGQSGRRAVRRDQKATRGGGNAERQRPAQQQRDAEQPRRAQPRQPRQPSNERATRQQPQNRPQSRPGSGVRAVERAASQQPRQPSNDRAARQDPQNRPAPSVQRGVVTPRGATRDRRERQTPGSPGSPDVRQDRQRNDRGGRASRPNNQYAARPPRRGGRSVTSIGFGPGGLSFYYGPGRYRRYPGSRYPVYNRVRFGTGFGYQFGFSYGHPYGYGYAFRVGHGWGYWPYYPVYAYGTYVTTYDRYDLGAVRLQVRPRHADVFVDGYFAGTVDDFDGTFQRLRIEAGPHEIEIHADGYEPLFLDVYVRPGETTKYEGYLQPQRLP